MPVIKGKIHAFTRTSYASEEESVALYKVNMGVCAGDLIDTCILVPLYVVSCILGGRSPRSIL